MAGSMNLGPLSDGKRATVFGCTKYAVNAYPPVIMIAGVKVYFMSGFRQPVELSQ